MLRKLYQFLTCFKQEKPTKKLTPRYYYLERVVRGLRSKLDLPDVMEGSFLVEPKLGEKFHFFREEIGVDSYFRISTGKVTRIDGDGSDYIFTTVSGSKYKLNPIDSVGEERINIRIKT
jgi:hypothetical protein